MKKLLIVIIILTTLLAAGYIYLRFHILRSKDFKPDTLKSKSILDLRPRLITKLQQLVKDGSHGLYILSIGQIEAHLKTGGVDIRGVHIIPDSTVLANLRSNDKLPDEVFKISIDSFHLDGIGVEDLLNRRQLDLSTISLTGPIIEIFPLKKANAIAKHNTVSLFQNLMKQVDRISIKEILVQHGIFISHNFARNSPQIKLDNIAIKMDSLLIDSSTQNDTKRFLFAEEVQMSVSNLMQRTADSLYFIKCGSVVISTRQNTITATGISVKPRYSRKQFESQLFSRKYMFTIDVPRLSLSGIDWWKIVNRENMIAKRATMENARCEVYLDRSLPFRKIKPNNFPHQLLMRAPLPFSIEKMKMTITKLQYTEFNPGMNREGSIVVSNVNGTVTNITNIAAEIRKNPFMISTSSGSFMNHVPLDIDFHFNLAKYKTGTFTMDLKIGRLDTSTLNPITGPLAEFIFKRGILRQGTAHVEGNNFRANGRGMLLYDDLFLESLKKRKSQPGKVKERKLLSFIGNVFLIKNSNPSRGKDPRKEVFSSERNDHQPFFSLVWKTIFIGVLKSIGLPAGFADKPY